MNSISSPTELVFMYTLTLYHKMLLFQRKRTKKELWGEGDWELPQNSKGVKESLSQTLFLPLSNITPGGI